MYNCRFCFETFQNRDDVIVPCKCNGEMKYVCKDCLNKYFESDGTDRSYEECPTCKTKYQRERHIDDKQINKELLDDSIFEIGLITLSLAIFIGLAGSASWICIMILFVYILSICILVSYVSNYSKYITVIYLFLLILLLCPHVISYYGVCLWGIVIYGLISLIILGPRWDSNFVSKYNNLIRKIKCKMFDYDMKNFVDGVN